MLIRASLGMAVAMSLIGLAQNVWQLAALRLLAGFLGGYSSGSTLLVATQTPKERSGWALGCLASGIMAGNLAGPLLGGTLPLAGPADVRQPLYLSSRLVFGVAASDFVRERLARPAAFGRRQSGRPLR